MTTPISDSPWSASIAVYLMLIGAASGVSLASFLIRTHRRDPSNRFERLSAWSALTLIGASAIILITDLDKPQRFFLMLTEFSNVTSPMSIGAKLIGVKTLLLGVEVYLLRSRARSAEISGRIRDVTGEKLHAAVDVALALVSFALAIYPAALLSRTWISPLASTSGGSAIFLSTALLEGVALGVLLAICIGRIDLGRPIMRRLRGTLLALIGVEAVLLFFEGLTLHGSGRELTRLLQAVLEGHGAFVFWALVVAAGLLLPALGLISFPRNRYTTVGSALAAFAGACATRYLIFAIR